MAKKDFKKEDKNLENVQEALTTTSTWIETNMTKLTVAIVAVVVIVLCVLAVNAYVVKPKKAEANNENAKAVVYFAKGEYGKALQGDGVDCIGFEKIAQDYKLYQSGKLAALYAGVCYYQLGEYGEAAACLKKFSADDLTIDPAAKQLLGDAFVQMQEYDKAVKAFESAAKSGNELIAPMSLKKAGLVYMELDNKKAAHKCFKVVKSKYPSSSEAQDIDKYIALTK